MTIKRTDFGTTSDDKAISLYTLTNKNGASVQMMNYGAIIVSINVPDKDGVIANVNLGFDKLAPYLKGHPFFGATVGRFANRIASGKFTIGADEYQLATNIGKNHLHGGRVGFDKKVWKVEEIEKPELTGLKFSLFSPDRDEGYPGNMHVDAIYLWDNEDRLTVQFRATTDDATHINMTNHAYFNLAGADSGGINKHRLQLFCDQLLEVDDSIIPTGNLLPVGGTVFDFTEPHAIGDSIDKLKTTKGYDHCYVVNGQIGSLRPAAIVIEPNTHRALEVKTTQPGIQFYTGNNLPGNETSNGSVAHDAFCLETQHYPNSPNQPNFPSTLLQPGETYEETTTFRFFVASGMDE